MYNKGDNTFKLQPKIMSLDVLENVAIRINEHIEKSNLNLVNITFHGGEPMLVGKAFFENAIKIINRVVHKNVIFSIQTNGTLLNKSWFDLFERLNIHIGISIDGPKEYHDLHRVYHNGEGSFNQIIKNLNGGKLISNYGILFVINPLIPVKNLYSFIKQNKISTLNLLLPDHHYNDLPIYNSPDNSSIQIDIGDWLVDFYELWRDDRNKPNISFFENIIKSFFELSNGTQILGKCFNDVICIETDGGIEVIDSLRTCESGITRNTLNVKISKIDEIFKNELYKLYYNSHLEVSKKCKDCEVVDFCGGGFLPHRYSKDNMFDNPSVYCKDLFKLIKFIETDIKSEIEKI